MAGQRRYRVGEHPVYDNAFDWYKTHSTIFSPGNADINHVHISTMMHDLQGVEKLLMQWKGDEEGCYIEGYTKCVSVLAEAKDEMAGLEVDFKYLNQRIVNSGRSPLKEPPVDLQEKIFKQEAKLDCITAEIGTLERLKEKFESEKTVIKRKGILKGGPRGIGRLRNQILAEIDGQPVSQTKKGILYIDCPESPYHRMKAADYHDWIVKPYGKAMAKAMTEKDKLSRVPGTPAGSVCLKRPPLPKIPENVKLVEIETPAQTAQEEDPMPKSSAVGAG